jgi:cell division protein FtsW
MRFKEKAKKVHFDKMLLITSLLILAFGLVMLFSASVAVGLERFGDSGFFIKRQLISLVMGAFVFYIAYKVDYHVWHKWSLVILIGSIILLILVLIPGIGASGQGAQRWIDLGFFGFQPSEAVKLAVILYMSAWVSERGESSIKDVKQGLIPFISLLALLAVLIMKQPDFGTLTIIMFIALVLFFTGGADIKHIFGLVLSGGVMAFIAIKTAPYRMARLLAFLNPQSDPQGAGYHIAQAKLAVGSGGLFGLGLGQSRQKFFYLPEVTGDSIFAVIAEELGFFFSSFVILLFLAFFWRSIKIASTAPDKFGKLVAVGIGVWISVQAFVNIGAMLGVLPLTGLTLPLMSYGGSSLIMTLAGIGVLLNISKQCKV